MSNHYPAKQYPLRIKWQLLAGMLLLFTRTAFAQTGKISGEVSGKKEMTGAVVTLLKTKDSSIVKTTLCNADGRFEFELVKDNSYLVSVSYTGYAKYFSSSFEISENNPSVNLPVIVLQEAIKEMQEIKVTAKKPLSERKIDRVVMNPDAHIGNAGATCLEVLEKAPGVMIDANGIISLKGKQGVMVFIDDKPSYLSAADLAAYLRSLTAGSVETIELMTNPPAKYDAAGNAGVINIRLKKIR
jgi:hypothetical protein